MGGAWGWGFFFQAEGGIRDSDVAGVQTCALPIYALEIVGQHVQRHFGGDPFQGLHLEVGIAHPVFDGAERMLDGFTPLLHLLRMLVEPLLDDIKDVFMFPAGNSALLGRGAAILDGAYPADRGPVAPQAQPSFLVGVEIGRASCRERV